MLLSGISNVALILNPLHGVESGGAGAPSSATVTSGIHYMELKEDISYRH